jgi:hypothetical protein
VPPSVMPKGVGHNLFIHLPSAFILVPPSVMPKGVEHMVAAASTAWACSRLAGGTRRLIRAVARDLDERRDCAPQASGVIVTTGRSAR